MNLGCQHTAEIWVGRPGARRRGLAGDRQVHRWVHSEQSRNGRGFSETLRRPPCPDVRQDRLLLAHTLGTDWASCYIDAAYEKLLAFIHVDIEKYQLLFVVEATVGNGGEAGTPSRARVGHLSFNCRRRERRKARRSRSVEWRFWLWPLLPVLRRAVPRSVVRPWLCGQARWGSSSRCPILDRFRQAAGI
jgi:hypothetical protein